MAAPVTADGDVGAGGGIRNGNRGCTVLEGCTAGAGERGDRGGRGAGRNRQPRPMKGIPAAVIITEPTLADGGIPAIISTARAASSTGNIGSTFRLPSAWSAP